MKVVRFATHRRFNYIDLSGAIAVMVIAGTERPVITVLALLATLIAAGTLEWWVDRTVGT